MGEAVEKASKPSAKAKALSARLCAVQAIYQILQTGAPVEQVLQQHLDDAPTKEIDGEQLVVPDGALLKKILLGAQERKEEILEMLDANLKPDKEGGKAKLDMLLQAILLCGGYELLAHQDIDSPIIINDYLNVTHGFYDKGAVSLVNGMLDALAKSLRA